MLPKMGTGAKRTTKEGKRREKQKTRKELKGKKRRGDKIQERKEKSTIDKKKESGEYQMEYVHCLTTPTNMQYK